jgi:outer membrane protein assembly factor BamB
MRRVGVLTICVLAGCLASRTVKGVSGPDLVRAAGVKGGLVVHVGDDVGMTGALRLNDSYLVQGLARELEQVTEARAQLRAKGLLGPVTVIHWDGKRLPYADNMVNLLILANADCRLPNGEIERALAPRGVVMVSARAESALPELPPLATRHSPLEGEWKTFQKPVPSDIDEWTHFLHGPDNNAVAEDTRVEPPRYMQWVSGPQWGRSHDHLSGISAVVSAQGRLSAIVDEGPIASVKAPSKWMLVARDAFNGVLLWKREVGPWEDQLRPFRSGPAELPRRLLAVGQRLYATLGYGAPVLALDAASGETVHTYEGTENAHEILFHDGTLYVVISAPLETPSPTTGEVVRKFPVWRGSYLEYVTRYKPKHIRALDAASGKLLWEKKDDEARDILPLTLTVGEGKVFFQNAEHLVALAASSGKHLWRAERPGPRQRYAWLTPTVLVKDGVVLSADRAHAKPVDTGREDEKALEWRVSANHILTDGELVAFSAETGKQLWSVPSHEGFNAPADVLVVDGKVFSGALAWGKQPGVTNVYDLHTGRVVARRSPDQKHYRLGFGHHRCHRNKATSKYVIQGRAGVEFLDVDADRAVADHWVRGACQYGTLPCNGLVYAPTHPCACYVSAKLSGFNALAGERKRPSQTIEASRRLEKGPAYASPIPQSAIGNPQSEWPTYRHDAARSGATAQPLSPKLESRWERGLAGPLTAVVVADGRLYVAQREAHTVHALRAQDGSSLWSYTAGGRVDSPPTLFGGRAYFASADGWMYCLRAEDGALVWRFRIAPEPRQIVSYGQLESVWPAPGTVLVRQALRGDGTWPLAYASAGRSSYVDGGVHLCAVDAMTGQPAFTRRVSHRDPETGQEPQDTIRGVSMPGAIPDVLSSDGRSVFMRHQRFDLKGEVLPQNADHIFCSAGFVDDTWWHRTYLQYGNSMRGGYGGWGAAGNTRISGKALVMSGNRAYGFGRKGYTSTGSHLGLQSEFHLFAADAGAPKPAKGKKGRRPMFTTVWSRSLPFLPRAMALAGNTLLVAGPREVVDFDAARPAGPVELRALSAEDGTDLETYKLEAPPVYDSFAVCNSHLYFATVDGRVHCYGEK